MGDVRVLIAGSAGQVARALVAAAPAAGLHVTALGRPDLDLTDPVSIDAVLDKVRPDIVINAAAYTAVDQAEADEAGAFALNAVGAGQLAAAAARLGAPIFHLSTDYVFDGSKPAPYAETDPVAPLGVYGRSKLAGEEAVAAANPRHLIFRTAWVYSPVGKNFAKTMLRVAEARGALSVVHDQVGNPTSAADIAAALWKVAGRITADPSALRAGTYHMTASGEASWAEFAEEILRVSAELGGPSASVTRITSSEYPTPTRRPANSRLDCTKLSRAFGVILPQWQVSTRACIEELVRTKGWAS
jgi:dTDP-4-dehydrorhamnose reductase